MDGYNNQQRITETEYGSQMSTGETNTTSNGAQSVPPPPMGYPTKETEQNGVEPPVETRSKGDGFWKGCCAGLCCCCALDMCF